MSSIWEREGKRAERTEEGRSNNASTKGETLLADSTSKSQKLANCGCEGSTFYGIIGLVGYIDTGYSYKLLIVKLLAYPK